MNSKEKERERERKSEADLLCDRVFDISCMLMSDHRPVKNSTKLKSDNYVLEYFRVLVFRV